MQIKSFLRTLTLLHGSLIFGLIVFALFVYFQNRSFKVGTDSHDYYLYIVPTIALLGYFLGKYLFQKQLQSVNRKDDLTSKLTRYLTASIIQYALLEGPALFALASYYINGNALHLVIGLSLLAYLIKLRPKIDTVIKALPLSQTEEQQLKRSEH
ncbi:hypothetical protein [Ulvibacterium sp.]|uniref:hypothetical protein n=1 Tax=Ulvibacterium sp. TaxID=2665914 RepID=UPI00261700D0|nr:hypothetical protein [Ulvibacterium sp.]